MYWKASIIVLLMSLAFFSSGRAEPAAVVSGPGRVGETSLAQDDDVAVTIYHSNLALVRDVRTLELEKGRREVKFQDVAALIDPTSVYFTSLTAPDEVAILEQNYEYDLVNSSKILQKYIDQNIRLDAKEGVSYAGTLLSASGRDIILREADGGLKIVNMNSVENMSFPNLPEGLITRPTLVWKIDCKKSGRHRTEVGYLTRGLQWHAEYVGVVNDDDTKIELGGWVSIDNKSGATYHNAALKLVAGDVHRARERIHLERQVQRFTAQAAAAPDGFAEKAFFEYHLYTLQRPATVANNQIKQISLFPSTEVQVEKKYLYRGERNSKRVQVNLEFKNRQELGLGIPLPKGKVRVYKRDEDGALIFIGEDFVDHTPKDEQVRIHVGNAFDVVGERTQKQRRTIGKESWEETWEIKLRNHKEETVEIVVVERMQPNWEILQKSHDFKQKDAFTIEFVVTVPSDGEVVVEYLVRYNR
ncbi:MAG: DUF4139 domain-containing protein [bacterium]